MKLAPGMLDADALGAPGLQDQYVVLMLEAENAKIERDIAAGCRICGSTVAAAVIRQRPGGDTYEFYCGEHDPGATT